MKRYITILLAVVSLSGSALAQSSAQSVLGTKVEVKSLEYQSDSVLLNLEFNLEDLEIGSQQSVVFAPKLFKGESELELPTVVVKSRGGARSYRRAVALGNKTALEEYDNLYGTPYKVIEYYGSGKNEKTVQYSMTLPYETWMVDSELSISCSKYGCCNIADSGMLAPQNNALAIEIPEVNVEGYDAIAQVELIKPEKVAVKRRDIAYSSALTFVVNSTRIDPNLANNQAELNSIDEMMQSVLSDSDYTITKVNITGFASPEGSLESNMKLSEGRAKALEELMKRKYRTIASGLYSVKFGGENWTRLAELVEEMEIADKQEILRIIRDIPIEKGREKALMDLNGGQPYRYLLKNVFPATRLVVVDVEYNIDAYDIERIKELISSKPQNLSLEEMYRLSEMYEVGDTEFESIFLTAASVYPEDYVALHNALVVEIRLGAMDRASELVGGIDHNTDSGEINNTLGVYYMMSGDYTKASELLSRAEQQGSSRAAANLKILETRIDIERKQEENEKLKAKIYGY